MSTPTINPQKLNLTYQGFAIDEVPAASFCEQIDDNDNEVAVFSVMCWIPATVDNPVFTIEMPEQLADSDNETPVGAKISIEYEGTEYKDPEMEFCLWSATCMLSVDEHDFDGTSAEVECVVTFPNDDHKHAPRKKRRKSPRKLKTIVIHTKIDL